MNYKINVLKIDDTWQTCRYKWRVFVAPYELSKHDYILNTLKQWFGDAAYFWETPGRHAMFLAGKK